MSLDLQIDLSAGSLRVGDIALDITPVMNGTAMQVGGTAGFVVRALSFGERFAIVAQAAGSPDPADILPQLVLQNALVQAASRDFNNSERQVLEALALKLAGAEVTSDNLQPGYLSAVMRVAQATGWTMQQIDATAADRIDQLALMAAPPPAAEADGGWTKLVFQPRAENDDDPSDDSRSDQNHDSKAQSSKTAGTGNLEHLRRQLALNLLRRMDNASADGVQNTQLYSDSMADEAILSPAVFGSRLQNPKTGAGQQTRPGPGTMPSKFTAGASDLKSNSPAEKLNAPGSSATARRAAEDDEFFGEYPLAELSSGDGSEGGTFATERNSSAKSEPQTSPSLPRNSARRQAKISATKSSHSSSDAASVGTPTKAAQAATAQISAQKARKSASKINSSSGRAAFAAEHQKQPQTSSLRARILDIQSPAANAQKFPSDSNLKKMHEQKPVQSQLRDAALTLKQAKAISVSQVGSALKAQNVNTPGMPNQPQVQGQQNQVAATAVQNAQGRYTAARDALPGTESSGAVSSAVNTLADAALPPADTFRLNKLAPDKMRVRPAHVGEMQMNDHGSAEQSQFESPGRLPRMQNLTADDAANSSVTHVLADKLARMLNEEADLRGID